MSLADLWSQPIVVLPGETRRHVMEGDEPPPLTSAQATARAANAARARAASANARRLPDDERRRRQRAAVARYKAKRKTCGVVGG